LESKGSISLNIFKVARECFNQPEEYAIVSTRAQTYVSLFARGMIDRDEYIGLVEDLQQTTSHYFVNENKLATSIFFDKIKKGV